jgi:hypothetical protein
LEYLSQRKSPFLSSLYFPQHLLDVAGGEGVPRRRTNSLQLLFRLARRPALASLAQSPANPGSDCQMLTPGEALNF